MRLILVFVASLLASSATIAGGSLIHRFFPVTLFEGTMIFAAMLLIGCIGIGLMSIVDGMNQRFEYFCGEGEEEE